ncbi:hypothetical protein EAE96_008248 [Botrytis aclada]|nr:hypothetical protein EAE96_008248 [Botrytis aclada]
MRLSTSRLLLPFFLISLSFNSSLVVAQALPLDRVRQMKDGSTDGGCDANGRKDILNIWQRKPAPLFFGLKTSTKSRTNPSSENTLKEITNEFSQLQSYFGTPPGGAKAGLFCGSDWLKPVEGGLDAVARDIMGNQIWIGDKPRTINDVYHEYIDPNDVPFWSEDPKGYEFTAAGEFCSENPTTKAATSGLKAVSPGGDDDLDNLFGVTLCPLSFDATDALDTLPPVPVDDNAAALVGVDGKEFKVGTSLSDALPKSATLFHETLHFLYADRFLAGREEKYSMMECIRTKWKPSEKRINPENYVFFAAAMWYRQHGYDFSSGNIKILT